MDNEEGEERIKESQAQRYNRFAKTNQKRNSQMESFSDSFSLRKQTRTLSLQTKRYKIDKPAKINASERNATCKSLVESLKSKDITVVQRFLTVISERLFDGVIFLRFLSNLQLFYVFQSGYDDEVTVKTLIDDFDITYYLNHFLSSSNEVLLERTLICIDTLGLYCDYFHVFHISLK